MARQKLGQHFLIRGSVLERIARAACPETEPLVIEIGPGRGALTAHLLKRAEHVIAIEVDPYLAEHMRRKFTGEPRLEVIEADALTADLGKWGQAVIAGNLPYYAASGIIQRVLKPAVSPRRGVFLVQKEVAARASAAPGSREYGYFSVAVQLFAEAELLFEVKPAAFHPPPQVDSAVLRLRPRARAVELGIGDTGAFLRFAGLCFHQKRKTIRNNLAGTYGPGAGDLPESALRAEQIGIEGFAGMYRRLVP